LEPTPAEWIIPTVIVPLGAKISELDMRGEKMKLDRKFVLICSAVVVCLMILGRS